MIKQDPSNEIYNRHNDAIHKDEQALAIRASKVIQSAEINELQSVMNARHERINNVLFKQGDIVRGGTPNLDHDTGELRIDAGAIYLNSNIFDIETFTATVPTTGKIVVGVWLITRYLSENDDPTLRNPAIGTRGAGEPGAWRIVVTAHWGLPDEALIPDALEANFYPVLTGNDGYLNAKEPPPQINSMTQALAKYDRDSTGSQYVINGMIVSAVDSNQVDAQGYVIDAGRARIAGYAIEYPTSRRFELPVTASMTNVDSEPHLAKGGNERIDLNRHPLANLHDIRIESEKTVTITHGNHANVRDVLPDATVVSVSEVKQGATIYSQGSDFQLVTGEMDWALVGNEPAPGSTYSVTYRYISAAVATDVDYNGFSVDGAVAGTLIYVTYDHYLKRIDRLCIDEHGEPHMIVGVETYSRPLPPHVPDSLLLLATIYQDFISTSSERDIDQDGQRLVSMAELNLHNERLDYLTEMLAQTRLEQSASMGEAGRKRGLFADPFMTNGFRDLGRTQTGIIHAGQLMINVDVQSHDFNLDNPLFLPYDNAVMIEQLLSNECMPVNPYAALDLPPAVVTLSPAIDRWVIDEKTWLNPIIQTTTSGTTRARVDIISESHSNIATLRSIVVNINIEGFTPTERLVSATFDSINILPAAPQVADNDGVISFDFTIPGGVPAGRKLVAVSGDRSSRGQAIFVGQGELNQQVLQRNVIRRIDPLAQTFTLPESRQIGQIDLWFCRRGNHPVIVQIRETLVGIPTQTIVAETRIQPDDISLTDVTWAQFIAPVLLQANVEYAFVVLSVETDPALKAAKLGDRDSETNDWITAQPYAVGALLSSSNASTWTPHNDRDLKFIVQRCKFNQPQLTQTIGTLDVTAATDFAVFMDVEIPTSQTHALIEATLPNGEVLTFADGQSIALPRKVTGTVSFTAVLSGVATASPVIYSNIQVLTGQYQETGNYLTRAIPAGINSRVRVLFDAFIPSGATVSARARGLMDTPLTWQNLMQKNTLALDSNKAEFTFETASRIDANDVQVELLLTGTPAARPVVENLRVLVIEGV